MPDRSPDSLRAKWNERRFVEGEARFRDLAGTGKWREVPDVFFALRRDRVHLNLRTYRACMNVLAECGRGKEAISYLQEMKVSGIRADETTLGHVATACARGGDLESALLILRGMNAKGMSASRTYNLVLLAIANGMMGRHAGLPGRRRRQGEGTFRRAPLSSAECNQAVALVQEMRAAGGCPNILTYNVLIAALARSRRPQAEVLGLLAQMRAEGLVPDSYTFVGVIKALVGADRVVRARQLLEDAKAHIVGAQLSAVYSAVISCCGASASWQEAVELLEEMRAAHLPRDEYTYCAVMNVCKESGRWEHAIDLLRQMREDGVAPNLVAYNTAIGACAFFGRRGGKPGSGAGKARDDLAKEGGRGRGRDGGAASQPRSASGKKMSMLQIEAFRAGDVALGLLDEMDEEGPKPDTITFSSLMSALSPRGESGADDVLQLFDALLKRGLKPNTITYVSVIRAWGDKRNWRQAEQMLTEMKDLHGLDPNRYCYAAVIKALSNGGKWERALEKIDEMKSKGLSPDPVVYTAAIGACEKDGQWEKALGMLDRMIAEKPPKHTLTWGYNAAVSALGKARQLEGAKALMASMRANGVPPDEYTYAALMRAAGVEGSWEEAMEMLEEMEADGLTANRVVYNTLVAALVRFDQHDRAAEMLTQMRTVGMPPDVTTYTTLVSGCKKDADWARAEAIVEEMQAFGIRPNSRTCTAIMKVYGDAGETERALAVFDDWDDQDVNMDSYCFNAIMGAMLKNGVAEKVLEIYEVMKSRGLRQDDITRSLAFNAAESTGNANLAYRFMESLRDSGQIAAVQVYADAIRACSCVNEVESVAAADGRGGRTAGERQAAETTPLQRASDIFAEARKIYPGDDGGRLYTSMLTVCERQGGVAGADEALRLLAEMRSLRVPRDVRCFAPTASVLAGGGHWEEAVTVLAEAAAIGLTPSKGVCERVRKAALATGQQELANKRLAEIVEVAATNDQVTATPASNGKDVAGVPG